MKTDIDQLVQYEKYFMDDMKEIKDYSEFVSEGSKYSYVSFQVFDMEQFACIILPLLSLMEIKEYHVSGGLNRNSGFINQQTPIVYIRLPRKKNISRLSLCLGSFGNSMNMDFNLEEDDVR
jgi:hypothetical protein